MTSHYKGAVQRSLFVLWKQLVGVVGTIALRLFSCIAVSLIL